MTKLYLGCVICNKSFTKSDDYMVNSKVWQEAKLRKTHPKVFIVVHMECLELMLKRKLVKDDFTDCPMNDNNVKVQKIIGGKNDY